MQQCRTFIIMAKVQDYVPGLCCAFCMIAACLNVCCAVRVCVPHGNLNTCGNQGRRLGVFANWRWRVQPTAWAMLGTWQHVPRCSLSVAANLLVVALCAAVLQACTGPGSCHNDADMTEMASECLLTSFVLPTCLQYLACLCCMVLLLGVRVCTHISELDPSTDTRHR